jgi:hypothetical protein
MVCPAMLNSGGGAVRQEYCCVPRRKVPSCVHGTLLGGPRTMCMTCKVLVVVVPGVSPGVLRLDNSHHACKHGF